jgi:carbon monoxide dehydrogenase subunit G
MRVERDLDVTAPPERLWAVLWDVPRMVACLPGCTEAREVEPQKRYEAHMSQRVGPISLSVPMQVTIVDVVPPGSLALEAKGRDGSLGASVAMSVRLVVARARRAAACAWRRRARSSASLAPSATAIIQRRAEELIDEFGVRLKRVVEG